MAGMTFGSFNLQNLEETFVDGEDDVWVFSSISYCVVYEFGFELLGPASVHVLNVGKSITMRLQRDTLFGTLFARGGNNFIVTQVPGLRLVQIAIGVHSKRPTQASHSFRQTKTKRTGKLLNLC